MAAGKMPYLQKAIGRTDMPTPELLKSDHRAPLGVVSTIMPTYTNPNNMSIITGVTSQVHGICGNYFYDEEKDAEVMMNDPRYLRCDSVLAQLSHSGVKVGVVTAKDKLRALLTHNFHSASFGFSAEKAEAPANQEYLRQYGVDLPALMGRPAPGIYDPDISIYCLEAGLRIAETEMRRAGAGPLLLYLSTTDYVQHKYRPEDAEAVSFFGKLDRVLESFHAMGATVGFTADHGMNDKMNYSGAPKVVYLEPVLAEAGLSARVVLPITDPYTVHHGALGSFATVYLSDKSTVMKALTAIRQQPGVYTALNREEAVRSLELPGDRIGDIVVVGDCHTVLGRSPSFHDLIQLRGILRSHGGLDEQVVPLFVNRPLKPEFARRLTTGKGRNFHLLDFLLNGLRA